MDLMPLIESDFKISPTYPKGAKTALQLLRESHKQENLFAFDRTRKLLPQMKEALEGVSWADYLAFLDYLKGLQAKHLLEELTKADAGSKLTQAQANFCNYLYLLISDSGALGTYISEAGSTCNRGQEARERLIDKRIKQIIKLWEVIEGFSFLSVKTTKPKERIDLGDKITQNVFANKLISNIPVPIAMEKRGSKKKINTYVNIQMNELEGAKIFTPANERPLDAAANEVYNAFITLYVEGGNEYITDKMLQRVLTGANNVRLTEGKMSELHNIINSLSRSWITIDATEEFKAYGYGAKFYYNGPLLMAEKVDAVEMNGNVSSAIHVYRVPILYSYASSKNQIIRYPLKVLDAPISNNTESIVLKSYLARRVEIMRNPNSKIKRVIRYDTLYSTVCPNGDLGPTSTAIKLKKKQIRDKVKKVLDYFIKIKFIKKYGETKKGHEIYSIEITL
jgi:hypothetical protein